MANLSSTHVSTTLQLLADVAAQRAAEIDDISPKISDTDSDDDYVSLSPVFDSFYMEVGSATVMQLTNFNAKELNILWISIMDIVQSTSGTGRGRRCGYSVKDVLFMVLVTAKNEGTWDFIARVFKIKSPTFERMVTKVLRMFSEPIYDKFVLKAIVDHSMTNLAFSGKCFANFPSPRYATDVTFQQANRPSGSVEEGKTFYSGNHKLYGYKVEVSVLPIVALNCTNHYLGSVADIDMFYKNYDYHELSLAKSERETAQCGSDIGRFNVKYSRMWTVSMDKGYQGAIERVRAIHSKHKPRNGSLSLSDQASKGKIFSDRIIVEKWFGRHCVLWGLFSHKWKWSESFYDDFFKLCSAFTNRYIMFHPL